MFNSLKDRLSILEAKHQAGQHDQQRHAGLINKTPTSVSSDKRHAAEWNKRWDDDLREDGWEEYRFALDVNGSPVAYASISSNDNEEDTGVTGRGAWLHKVVSHSPGAGRWLISELKKEFNALTGEAETSAGSSMFNDSGFYENGTGGYGMTVYDWKNTDAVINKHQPGQHDQQTHGRLKTSEIRDRISDLVPISNSTYKYSPRATESIRRGERKFAEYLLKSHDLIASTDWKSGLSKEAIAMLSDDTTPKEAIRLFTLGGLKADAIQMRDAIHSITNQLINSGGDGKGKVIGDVVTNSPALQGAATWLRSAISSRVPPAPVNVKLGTRSDCNYDGINIAAESDAPGQYQVHEYGHWIGHRDDDALAITKGFLKSRAGPIIRVRTVDGTGYEEIYSDTFVDEYAGRRYNQSADEILSVGLQHMYAAPKGFLAKDPDHFFLTLDLMSGGHYAEPEQEQAQKALRQLEEIYL